jgi:hypothetical protein
MTVDSAKSRRLVAVFLLGCVLFNYPILSLCNLKSFFFGIPLLYFYMFSAWLVLILLIVFATLVAPFGHSSNSSGSPDNSGRGD